MKINKESALKSDLSNGPGEGQGGGQGRHRLSRHHGAVEGLAVLALHATAPQRHLTHKAEKKRLSIRSKEEEEGR